MWLWPSFLMRLSSNPVKLLEHACVTSKRGCCLRWLSYQWQTCEFQPLIHDCRILFRVSEDGQWWLGCWCSFCSKRIHSTRSTLAVVGTVESVRDGEQERVVLADRTSLWTQLCVLWWEIRKSFQFSSRRCRGCGGLKPVIALTTPLETPNLLAFLLWRVDSGPNIDSCRQNWPT